MVVRLIIHTRSIELSDAHTFKNAAVTLEKEYNRLYPKDSVDRVFVYSGRDIVHAINRQNSGSIISLDIISHGNQGGIHIARRLAKPPESGLLQKRAHYEIRRYSDRPQTRKDAEYCEESMHGLYIDWLALRAISYYYNQVEGSELDVAYLYHIKYDRFRTEAYIKIHGCLIAETIPFINTHLRDNFA